MKLEDLFKDVQDMDSYEFEQRFNKLCRENYRFQNLNPKNRKVVLKVLKKYLTYVRRGIPLSHSTVYNESYKLYKKKDELDLTEEDLKDIRKILNELRKKH